MLVGYRRKREGVARMIMRKRNGVAESERRKE